VPSVLPRDATAASAPGPLDARIQVRKNEIRLNLAGRP